MNRISPALSRGERLAVVLFLLALVGFGVLVEVRSAYLRRRMGDLSVYLRASWAVRAGVNIYDVTDENGWHYHYPPLFALLLSPLADPPPGASHAGMVPYPVSVAIFYVVNLLLLALSVHWLAGALEESSRHAVVRDQDARCRRWWLLRLLPLTVCLPPIVHTMMRGQVNLFVLLLLCGLIACLIRRQHLRAGLCLAGAICLKVIPAYLLLVPLWRRDGRCLLGCALGLVLGLLVIPAATIGPRRTLQCYHDMVEKLILPALAEGEDKSRADELINVTATDSQSFLAVIHNTIYFNPWKRPATADAPVRWAHWLLAGLFTFLTLMVGRGRRAEGGPGTALFVGGLALIMIVCSPVCHTHYFALCVPLVMGLIALRWEEEPDGLPTSGVLGLGLGWGLLVLFALQIVGHSLPQIPIQIARDNGLALYTALLLWGVACRAQLAGHAVNSQLPPSRSRPIFP
jgi:hypothetical protein